MRHRRIESGEEGLPDGLKRALDTGRQYEMERGGGELRAATVLVAPRRGWRWRHAARLCELHKASNQSMPAATVGHDQEPPVGNRAAGRCSCVPFHIGDHYTKLFRKLHHDLRGGTVRAHGKVLEVRTRG